MLSDHDVVDFVAILLQNGLAHILSGADLASLRAVSRAARQASYAAIKVASLTLPSTEEQLSRLPTAKELGAFHAKLSTRELQLHVRCTALHPVRPVSAAVNAAMQAMTSRMMKLHMAAPTAAEDLGAAEAELAQQISHEYIAAYAQAMAPSRLHIQRLCLQLDINKQSQGIPEAQLPDALAACLLPALHPFPAFELSLVQSSNHNANIKHWYMVNLPAFLQAVNTAQGQALQHLSMYGAANSDDLLQAVCKLRMLHVLLVDWTAKPSDLETLAHSLPHLEVLSLVIGHHTGFADLAEDGLQFPCLHTLIWPRSKAPRSDLAPRPADNPPLQQDKQTGRGNTTAKSVGIRVQYLAMFPALQQLQGYIASVDGRQQAQPAGTVSHSPGPLAGVCDSTPMACAQLGRVARGLHVFAALAAQQMADWDLEVSFYTYEVPVYMGLLPGQLAQVRSLQLRVLQSFEAMKGLWEEWRTQVFEAIELLLRATTGLQTLECQFVGKDWTTGSMQQLLLPTVRHIPRTVSMLHIALAPMPSRLPQQGTGLLDAIRRAMADTHPSLTDMQLMGFVP